MPIKKTAPKAKPAAKQVEKEHSHANLESEIAALRKEVEALRSQCESCCKELKSLKAEPQQAPRDERVDKLISAISENSQYKFLRRVARLL